jgi:hypothetical protein
MSDMSTRFETIPDVAPDGWETTIPRYRVTRPVHPSGNDRHRLEAPFSSSSDPSAWQFAEREYARGEIIETRDLWPHPSFVAMNYAAKRTLEFFDSAPKSRLPRSPSYGGRIRLETGLDGAKPNVAAILKPRGDDRLRTVSPTAPRPAA